MFDDNQLSTTKNILFSFKTIKLKFFFYLEKSMKRKKLYVDIL